MTTRDADMLHFPTPTPVFIAYFPDWSEMGSHDSFGMQFLVSKDAGRFSYFHCPFVFLLWRTVSLVCVPANGLNYVKFFYIKF